MTRDKEVKPLNAYETEHNRHHILDYKNNWTMVASE